jgi:hypothetical protein
MNERPTVLPTLLGAALIALAFVLALRATAGLEWPCEDDFFRDMGGAQAILDGWAGSDPAYLGEVAWFNPLQPALFALLAVVTGLPLHVAYARLGPFVNLLGPIGFFLLARQLMGRWAALAALVAYLFLGKPDVPSWFQATYSPWAWPMDFAQGFFFLTAAAYVRAVLTRRLRWDVITGVLLGITFLAHTAPTLVFVGMIFFLTAFSPRAERLRAIRRLLVVGLVSLVVASPFLGPLLVNYKLQVLNHAPSEHEPIGAVFALLNMLTFRAAVAALGLGVTVVYRSTRYPPPAIEDERDDERRRARVLGATLFSAATLFGYGVLAQALQHRGIAHLPRMLPTYHFHLYIKAAESLLFGVGLVATVQWVVSHWPGRVVWTPRLQGAAVAMILLMVLAVHLPGHLAGAELNRFREDSERIGTESHRIALYDWLLQQTHPTDVFLVDMNVAMWTVAAADRKVVALGDQYSNIYVSYDERAGDLRRLYASLRDQDQTAFDHLAAKYRLTHVILAKSAPELCRVPPERLSTDRFTLVFAEEEYRVYRRNQQD